MKNAIVLAAGKGTRMHSDTPKVLHMVCQKPMVAHIVDNLKTAGAEKVVTVVGYGHEMVELAMEGQCEFALQEPQLGSGHAVMMAESLKDDDGLTLVVNGDCPCVRPETYAMLYDALGSCDMAVLTAHYDDADMYGRVVRACDGTIEKIVEYKDCTEDEKMIHDINTGIYAFRNQELFAGLKELKNDNAQHEYYITDLVEILKAQGRKVKAISARDPEEAQGINDCVQLAAANRYLQKRINTEWMQKGVTMINPDSTYIGPDVVFGTDVILYPNVYIYGKTAIGNHVTVYPQSLMVNAKVGNNTVINASEITDSEVKNDCQIGPYAHFRMNSVIEDKNRIGNFVEFKNVKFGTDSRCAHLTYLGDSDIGSKVNIGCGVITVNYDGGHKFHTTVKDGAFIGSNCNLIAPLTVGENSVVAAGSTATGNVPDGDMAIGRVRQENKPGYGKEYLDRNRRKK